MEGRVEGVQVRVYVTNKSAKVTLAEANIENENGLKPLYSEGDCCSGF